MAEYETILSEERNQVCIITLNRGKIHNAFNPEMISELTKEFTFQNSNPESKIVVLTGAGRSFSAGADLGYMESSKDFTLDENKDDASNLENLFNTIYSIEKPVLGMINGSAFGGGVGLVAVCDIAIAVERAIFAFSEVNLGIIPAVISPYVIPKIGHSSAKRYFLTGERFSANEALQIGLIHKVVSNENMMKNKVNEIVNHLFSSGPLAMAHVKELIRINRSSSFEDLRKIVIDRIASVRTSSEGREGLSAFLEKRSPTWKTDPIDLFKVK
ncbi:MAG: enoyl-CoA hydratase-related protein [Candidatus Hodarchaeales archaeon]|jgi:methylglutaconyl-CoA hydratase